MILVTGATGRVGREVVAQLVSAGHATRALMRDRAKAHFDASVEVAVGDLDQPDTLAKAVEGAEAVFSVALGAAIGPHETALAKAAKQAGVKRIVKLSVLGAGSGAKSTVLQWHEAGERAIQDSGVAWTFVRPGGFMSNALSWAGTIKSQGKVFAPFGDGKQPPIHPKDIAAVAVKALVSASHEGKAYGLTGPEALGMIEQVRILSEAIGKPITYVPVTDEVARGGMLENGVPAGMIDSLLQLAAGVRAGQLAQVSPTLEQVLGWRGLTFADWARENAAAFK